ncbi:TetR family transcriptional regulator C-terminal domain-containing protein [Martelella mediterranea]|uniref:TetR family transcriptional regulator n=1 Tax=Martelella mediterranea TaxID=293089 RepID=A0A4R3NXN7_9HYPH|nr:TetR family transcriptional regulator C-terminal domain-containing protein [Martelella mediterranea]TCT44510.1 TetR family transcriptional regulator [Martelella mediterranea]
MSRKPFRRASDTERRADLTAAMLDCIAEGGIQNATVREVAERAGVSGGLIRHYFETKDQLLQAAYRQTMGEMTGITAEATADHEKTPRERLMLLVIACLTPPMVDARRLSLWAAFIAIARIDPAMGAIHREGYLEFRDLIENLLADLFRVENRPEDLKEVRRQAIAINAALDGLWLEGCLADDLFENDELLETGIQSVEAITGLRLKS